MTSTSAVEVDGNDDESMVEYLTDYWKVKYSSLVYLWLDLILKYKNYKFYFLIKVKVDYTTMHGHRTHTRGLNLNVTTVK